MSKDDLLNWFYLHGIATDTTGLDRLRAHELDLLVRYIMKYAQSREEIER